MQFKDLNIMPDIIKALEKEQYKTPTPIQKEAIPVVLGGRDLLGCAQTGTGKTAAFAIPTLQLLCGGKTPGMKQRKIKALVITPTRELALQIYESFNTYGQYTSLKSCVVFGGVSQKPQEEDLKRGVDILVATPGRLLALMDQKLISLNDLKILILDEADRMLDMGFIHDVKKIIGKTPPKKQTLFFSATMPPDIARLADTILNNPAKIVITPVSSTVDTIDQYLYYTDKSNKKNLLLHILEDNNISSVLVFMRTKHGADRLIRQLAKSNVTAQAIHGDKSQGARQRALSSFKDKTLRILLATDIAARGIDIDELTHVINFDLPDTPETYVHRIGRTGRAGLDGTAISFCDFDEKEQLKDIEKLIGKKLKEISDHPYPLKNNFPAVKTTQPRRDTGRTEKSKSHSAAQRSGTSSERTSSMPKKKYRMTADGTLKEKKSYSKSPTKRKSSR
ncbi:MULTISPECIES: DEAD/DEAH box helicase [Lacrimispora]|jgi:ATP-dependent RNA helicase RhlE|uniref:DEAD/DEAH box helicase n=1 Tax=Lacrimispora TaxID=2719231 RepID=UPI000BE45485|nr:DEAD/DEAH box helicase [Lacrimispora amygdalina]MDK2966132.1 ATP-dependent helicase RhlE [Lacrimispora sp.]